MKAKVCMFVWNHFTNDARVIREATALTEEGYEVDVIAIHDPSNAGLKTTERMNGFNVRRVKKYRWLDSKGTELLKKMKITKAFFVLCVFFGMIKEGLSKNYDIYHSNDLNTLPQGYICKLLRRKKLIYDSHEVATSRTGYKGKKFYYLEKFLIKRIDKMIMTDETRAEYTAKKYGIEKPRLVHNYPVYSIPDKNAVNLYELLAIPANEPILLYQGGIQEGRGLEQIIEAIPYFRRGITVFIGDGKLKPKIVKMCEDLRLGNRVRFLKTVPVNDLLNYSCNAYLGFQVLQNICFNHYSTTSNKLFEYIMAEVPVVASDFPEIKRVVEGERVGICIDPHKPVNISGAVNHLLDSYEEYLQQKLNCTKAREKYNWENEKRNLIVIYDELSAV